MALTVWQYARLTLATGSVAEGYGVASLGLGATGAGARVSSGYGVASLALGAVGVGAAFDPIPFDILVNFSSGSGALDTTKLVAGVHGENWGTWRASPDYTVDHTVIEDHAVTTPFILDIGGTEYDGSEAQGITFDHSTDPAEIDVFELLVTGRPPDAQALMLARFDVEDEGVAPPAYYNDTLMFAAGGDNFSVAQYRHNGDGDQSFNCHSQSWNGNLVTYEGGWVLVGLRHDATNGEGEMFAQDAATLEVLGSSASNHDAQAAGDLTRFRFHDYLRQTPQNKVGSIKIKWIALREDMTFPPYPILVPAPTVVSASQTGVGEVTLTWTGVCGRYRIERQIDAGGWSVLNADRQALTLVDDGLSDGAVVEYRVSGRVGTQYSTADAFDPVEIDNPGEGYGTAALGLGATGVGARVSQSYGTAALAFGAPGAGVSARYGYGTAALSLGAVGVGEAPDDIYEGSGVASLGLGAVGVGVSNRYGYGVAALALGATGTGVASHYGYGVASLALGAVGVGQSDATPTYDTITVGTVRTSQTGVSAVRTAYD
jgi:hypothetical protein